MSKDSLIPSIAHKIYLIREHRVMMDSDLAELYGVETKNLNKAVTRNAMRFPADFMFRLTNAEYHSLRFQSGTLENGRGKHRKYLPLVFTEQGVAMLSGVLQSERAVRVNVAIMRTFVGLRKAVDVNAMFSKKLDELEKSVYKHDRDLKSVFEAIRRLMDVGAPLAQRKIKTISEK